MKKFVISAVAVMFIIMSFVVCPVYAGDTVIDKAGDWVATRGKEEPQKSLILSQRKAEREAKRAKKEMEKASKEMQKSMKKAFGQ